MRLNTKIKLKRLLCIHSRFFSQLHNWWVIWWIGVRLHRVDVACDDWVLSVDLARILVWCSFIAMVGKVRFLVILINAHIYNSFLKLMFICQIIIFVLINNTSTSISLFLELIHLRHCFTLIRLANILHAFTRRNWHYHIFLIRRRLNLDNLLVIFLDNIIKRFNLRLASLFYQLMRWIFYIILLNFALVWLKYWLFNAS